MTRRAKLSLDPKQHSKTPPPHGFDVPAPTPAEPERPDGSTAASRPGAGGTPARPAGGRGRAHRREPVASQAPDDSSGLEGATGDARPATPGHTPGAVLAVARVLSRRPLVRALAVGVAAGISIYLLRRRLF
jgi:hypothetical protein